MKKTIAISIQNPCSENWAEFSPTANGGHCSKCNNNVIDFTHQTDQQILQFFKNKPVHTCGRFRPDQLKSYQVITPLKFNPGWQLMKAGMVGLVLFIAKPSSAQVQQPKAKTETAPFIKQDASQILAATTPGVGGLVKSQEDNSPLPGVNVLIKGTTFGTVTDGEGKFKLSEDIHVGDVLQFSFIGLDTKEYAITKNNIDNLEISMSMSVVQMMGAVAVTDVYQSEPSALGKLWNRIKNIF